AKSSSLAWGFLENETRRVHVAAGSKAIRTTARNTVAPTANFWRPDPRANMNILVTSRAIHAPRDAVRKISNIPKAIATAQPNRNRAQVPGLSATKSKKGSTSNKWAARSLELPIVPDHSNARRSPLGFKNKYAVAILDTAAAAIAYIICLQSTHFVARAAVTS